jgi:hypothetical protein
MHRAADIFWSQKSDRRPHASHGSGLDTHRLNRIIRHNAEVQASAETALADVPFLEMAMHDACEVLGMAYAELWMLEDGDAGTRAARAGAPPPLVGAQGPGPSEDPEAGPSFILRCSHVHVRNARRASLRALERRAAGAPAGRALAGPAWAARAACWRALGGPAGPPQDPSAVPHARASAGRAGAGGDAWVVRAFDRCAAAPVAQAPAAAAGAGPGAAAGIEGVLLLFRAAAASRGGPEPSRDGPPDLGALALAGQVAAAPARCLPRARM